MVYVANEYGWDTYWPNTNISANNVSFGPFSSVSRNTAKYLTLKPMLTVVNVSLISMFTSTLAATATTSAGAIFVLPLMFYVNTVGWDWYDWYSNSAQATTPQKP